MRSEKGRLVGLVIRMSQRLREMMSGPNMTSGACVLTRARLAMLGYIKERGAVSMTELAGYLKISPPSATILADALESGGFVRRLAGKTDRRRVRIVITPKGRRALAVGYRDLSRRIGSVLARLTAEERSQLERMFTRLLAGNFPKK